MDKTYIIAEAGVNHNGDINLARQLIDAAAEARVNCIKFQTFKTSQLVSKYAQKAEYQKKTDIKNETQFDMLKKLELSFDDFYELKNYSEMKGLDFCSTSFDIESTEFLAKLHMPFWKIPSGEVTNLPYIIKIAKYNEPMIMSTGMCTMEEIEFIVKIIRKYNNQELTLLHCNTEYPTPFEDVNLKAMNTMKDKFNVRVGYSDHTKGIEVPIAAVALGAKVIEKHFTLSRHMEGPDHKASLEPNELKEMVTSIRNIEKALGLEEKKVSQSENKNKCIARKSIVAKKVLERAMSLLKKI
ncbi:N-acetylneuraminate synthase [Allocoprobacillus halotolerans]|uniref:N-acetylneuraminate synthase n=1 Tax=Allocoprobacillus halotolerans TaxID=2944914 RepID=UPI0025B627D8|nr:N-acetylneuraminate synthase [Allocoprobacillus halotolerans]